MPASTDPTARFSDRALYYADCRAGYPDSVIDALRIDPGLAEESVIVDVGSGTGLSSDVFLRNGFTVHGVEPNPEMRRAAEERLGRYSSFHSVEGKAEATTLPDNCADLVVCASAFHWFEPDAARTEFRRLLRPHGSVAIIRNGRNRDGSTFMREYHELFRRYSVRVPAHDNFDNRAAEFFAGNEIRTTELEYREQIDFQMLSGRILSYSTIPLPGQPGHGEMMGELREVFDRNAEDGRVWYLGKITLHVGRLS